MRYKCGKCRQFHWLSAMHFAKCKDCSFVAGRCEGEHCGGLDGARRSITAHVGWYRGIGVKKYGFEDFHRALVRPPVQKRTTTKSEKAGRRRAAALT